ncbi:MAG: hypothetical protein PHY82_05610 [Lentisphaeria bacterium]|nr:hypothetical protein [Lentisphaeria bacterium]
MKEQNYDFRLRHWEVHRPGRRVERRQASFFEVMLDEHWLLGCPDTADSVTRRAILDFQDYLLTSMNLSLRIVHQKEERVLWFDVDPALDRGFLVEVSATQILLSGSEPAMVFRGSVHLEDCMNLEAAPLLPLGTMQRKPLYKYRNVHSGCGIDEYPDAELNAILHAGYDMIVLFVKNFDQTTIGYCNFNDVIRRAKSFGLKVMFYNYMKSYKHPDDTDAEKFFDAIYGELFRRYPEAAGISLCGESLEFPSKDPATTGKTYQESFQDGIPDTRPSPGWYPCSDYPEYLSCIERAVHRVKPEAQIIFSTYNWGYTPLELRRKFLERLPKGITLSVGYEIFTQRTLEGLHTPVMDYTCSVIEPGYYFSSECEAAQQLEIPLQGNVNTAGIAWDFGCVPYVPAPQRWLLRDLRLREACQRWGVMSHYATHHYGWWECVAAELGRWSSWQDFEPDYDQLLQKIAVRDYGKKAARSVLSAWQSWSHAMDYYTASNEDQYGPWRVGAAYPLIFQPNLTRTMSSREIQFPTAPHAHFGWSIIKTLYQPFENEQQSPGFLRYPAELRSLKKMLQIWERGLASLQRIAMEHRNAELERLQALGHFIRNSIRTTIHIKQWWLLNMALQTAGNSDKASHILDQLEELLQCELDNARDTIPVVEKDSRLGWEPSMEYVCDPWHLNWKIRQLGSTLREINTFRKMLK